MNLAPVFEDRAVAIDLAALAAVSIAICVASHRLGVMTAWVPLVIAARMLAWRRLPAHQRDGWSAELALWLIALTAGAANDWNSVVRHEIYEYRVPSCLPGARAIPVWMLLFWGLVLRALVTLFRWRRLAPPPGPSLWRAGILLALALLTRQSIYRYYLDPMWSWLPFALALGVYLALARPTRYHLRLMALFALGGPLIEIAYIQLGGLHAYHLGWLGGVPVWIALWWVLAALLWQELSCLWLSRPR